MTGSSHLPQPLTSFLGRADEVAAIARALRDHRLVTLTGPGGVGKTRLAIESASAEAAGFREGARFIDLAPVRDGEGVAAAVLAGLGGPGPRGPAASALVGLVADQELLMVLDNCEQVIEAVAETVEQVLQGSAGVVVLATSREPLGVSGEVTWRVPPLELPASAETLPLREAQRLPAVQLFAERARLAVPSFELSEQDVRAVVRICRAVDCLPLALELAAARVRALPVAQVAERLGERLPMLSGGARTAPERQRTMEAAVRWSHDLLSEPEKVLFRRLAVFSGGWTLEAAEGVCGFGELTEAGVFPLLESLVDRSLVVATPESGGRFRFLEVIHEFARNELLAAGEAETLATRHCRWFRELAETAEPHLDGPSARYWLDLLDAEIENLRAALAWALEDESSRGDGLILLGNALWFWNDRGYLGEAYDLARRLLAAGPNPPAAHLQGLRALLWGADHALDGWAGERAALEAAEIARELGDEQALAFVLLVGASSRIYRVDRDLAGAREWALQALAAGERSGALAAAGGALWTLDLIEQTEGAGQSPSPHLSAAMMLAMRSGSPHLESMIHVSLGELARRDGELKQAVLCYERALAIARAVGIQRMMGLVQVNLALTAVEGQDWQRATDGLRELFVPARALAPNASIVGAMCVAAVEAERGDAAQAARWLAFFDEGRGFPVDSADMPVLAAAMKRCRERLGARFDDVYGAGRGLEAAQLVREVKARLAQEEPAPAPEAPGRLSPRETEILRLVAGGESNQAIADRLVLSRRTVENHVANVYSKIGAANRVEAARFAVDHGLAAASLA